MRAQLLMPIAEWACYLHELPALAAERSLQRAEAAALPWMTAHDRRRALARLRALALGDLTGAPSAAPPARIDDLALRHAPSNASLKDLPAHPEPALSAVEGPVEGRATLPTSSPKGIL